MKISAVINTFNSEKFLRPCLEGVKGFDEIVICDMYSTDSTLDIAREYDAKIVMHELGNGIVEPARTFAIQQASSDWIFVVDSDEVVPAELKDYLYKIIQSKDCEDALFVPRKNYFMDRYMRASFPDYQLRFFKKDKFIQWPVTIHSHPEINGTVGKIPRKESLAFIHLEENTLAIMVAKWNKYSDREVERRKDKRATIAGLIFKSFHRFFQPYILKGGFRDGKEGFIYASMRAFYKYLTVAKIIEYQNQSGLGRPKDS